MECGWGEHTYVRYVCDRTEVASLLLSPSPSSLSTLCWIVIYGFEDILSVVLVPWLRENVHYTHCFYGPF